MYFLHSIFSTERQALIIEHPHRLFVVLFASASCCHIIEELFHFRLCNTFNVLLYMDSKSALKSNGIDVYSNLTIVIVLQI